ncbi:T9SS type A sorting domain-containing protein [Christiangramia salexigens]|uniref:Secretion system C-terminal sorting domain-containing protein n=1 Tax=Christiangramia salexigens TaxID=1913577 RepID=A0A1L3J505_9FLAO|nr:T9SS type A sorting domain-containing protein [Christiangramia salexigens]APG60218.1 hypothetical protein LPB144_07260 [Christiangramia salexigens]
MENYVHFNRLSALFIIAAIWGNLSASPAAATCIGDKLFEETSMSSTNDFQNQSTKAKDSRLKIRLRFNSPKGYSRQILVTGDNRCTGGYDLGFDAILTDNVEEDMFWLIDKKAYVIQGVPDFSEEQALAFGIKISEQKEFTIKIDATENWPENKPIYLKDKVLDSIHDIIAAPYKHTVEPGLHEDRFELIFYKEEIHTDTPEIVVNKPWVEEPFEDFKPENDRVDVNYNHYARNLDVSNPSQLIVDKIILFDMRGKMVQQFSKPHNHKDLQLSLNDLPAGVYIVKTISEKGIINKKVAIR